MRMINARNMIVAAPEKKGSKSNTQIIDLWLCFITKK